MSEDGTKTGFGFGLGPDGTRSTAEKKIRVRLKNGKVYGPYQRVEIVSFLRAKKLNGNEMILMDDGRDWMPITSDVEFFDILQEVLFGETKNKPSTTKISKEPGRASSGTRTEIKTMEIKSVPEAPKLKDESVRYTAGENPRVVDLGRGRLASPADEPAVKKIPSSSPSLDSLEPFASIAQPGTAATKGARQKTRPAVLLSAAVVVLGVLIFGMGKKHSGGNAPSENFGAFTAQSLYARPLAIAADGFSPAIGALPTQLESSPELNFPEGFNATVWIEDLKALELADPKQRLSTRWWLRWSWDAYWLGLTVWAFDKNMGEALISHSLAIVNRVDGMGLLKEPAASMFKGAQEIRDLDWDAASKSFDLVSAQNQVAAWLNEESKWQAFWSNGAKGESPKRVVAEYESGPLETSSQVRSAFVDRDSARYLDWIEQLAAQDPISTTLWFTTAQVQWRINKEGTQAANKLFTIGLGSLSLQPQPMQLVYWTQFSQFLSLFGRQATTVKALNNRDAILKGNLERDPAALRKWWDLNQSEFDMERLAAEVFKRSEKGMVDNRDLATLFVLGYVIPGGAKYLGVAGNHFAMEKNWSKALQIYNQIVKIDKTAPEGWGGLAWVKASLYRFDEAFRAVDELVKIKTDRPENIKFEALISSLAHEYPQAAELFETYLRRAPNDPWAHYFNALNWLDQQQNVQCVASANLAFAHAEGELHQKAKLLLLKCRVLAKMQVKQALAELEKMVGDEPNNTAVAIEYINAHLATDLDSIAAQFADNAIRRFPRSYDLRMKRADIYKKDGDFDRAVAYYQRAMKDRPDSIEPMLRIGEIYDSQGKLMEAAQSFEAASVKDSQYPEVFLVAARAYVKVKKVSEAARLYEREIEARPAHVAAFLEAAEFYLTVNDPNSVERVFAKMSSEYQEHPRVRTRLAQAYLASKQLDKALEEAQRAIALDPKIGEAHRVAGMVYDEQGQYDIAKKHLENYLMLIPGAIDAEAIKARISHPPYQ